MEGEPKWMCCASEKVQKPPNLHDALLNGDYPKSKDFLYNLRSNNSVFQMTLLGVIESTSMSPLKREGKSTTYILSYRTYICLIW